MRSIKHLFFASILFSMQLNGMQRLGELRKSILDYAKSIYPTSSQQAPAQTAAKKPIGSPEEGRFMRQLEDWTSNDRKFTAFTLVMRESLKPASPFIKTLMKIATKNITPVATLTGNKRIVVNSVSWSPNGNYALSGSSDGKIKLWDLTNKRKPKELATLTGHVGSINSVSWSPDGNYALSGSSDDNTIMLWDLRDKQNPNTNAIATLTEHEHNVTEVSWSSDGNYAISGSWDNTIKLWDLNNKQNPNTKSIATLTEHNGSVYSVSWSPDGKYALSGSTDRTLKLWDLRDKQNPNTKSILTGHNNALVSSVSWSPDGNYALSGSDKIIKLWDLSDKQKPKDLDTLSGHNRPIHSVSWSPDGNYALSGSEDKTLKLWDLTNKQNPIEIPTLMGHNDTVSSVSWSPDGNYALSGSDNAIKLWDVSFVNLPKQIMKLVDSRDGIIQYLLLSSILEFRKNQQDSKHKLYTASPKPFVITYPKLKKLFNGLPGNLARELVKQGYVIEK